MDFTLLGFTGLCQALNVHPAFVHFPIALFPASLLFYCLGLLRADRALLVAGRACLLLGALGAAVAAGTGFAAQRIPHNEAIHHILTTHRALGLAILALGLALAAWSFAHVEQRPRAARSFLAVLACSAYLVLQNGDLGSRMVFLHGAAVKPLQAAQEGHAHGKEGHEHERKAGGGETRRIEPHPEVRKP